MITQIAILGGIIVVCLFTIALTQIMRDTARHEEGLTAEALRLRVLKVLNSCKDARDRAGCLKTAVRYMVLARPHLSFVGAVDTHMLYERLYNQFGGSFNRGWFCPYCGEYNRYGDHDCAYCGADRGAWVEETAEITPEAWDRLPVNNKGGVRWDI